MSLVFTNDPVADYERYSEHQEKALKIRPLCSHCDEHIQDEFCYVINGEVICEACMDRFYRKDVDDLKGLVV